MVIFEVKNSYMPVEDKLFLNYKKALEEYNKIKAGHNIKSVLFDNGTSQLVVTEGNYYLSICERVIIE